MNYEQKCKTGIEIPFGAKDSELKGWEYTIPEGMEAIIKDGKVIVKEKESEDEKIRKEIIGYLNSRVTAAEETELLYFKRWISYLEKQKDASKAIEAVDRIDKYIDEQVANAHDMKDSNPDKKYYRGWDDALGKMAGILQDVYSDEKQKEQKPAEWSEEDEEMRNLIITIFEVNHPDGFFKANELGTTDMRGVHTEEIISWLKSLRPQPKREIEICPHSVKSKSYSETGYPIKDCDYGLEIAADILRKTRGKVQGYQSDDGLREHDTAIAAVENADKFLRPHWKPSEEQIKALKYAAYHMLPGEEYRDILFSLLKDLTKLM